LAVQVLAQCFEFGDIDLFNVRKVRNLAFRRGQAFGDDAP
jgi:hypothetical protein